MTWTKYHTNLREVLANLFPETDDAKTVAVDAGIPRAHLALKSKPVNNWQGILEEALRRGVVPRLIDVALREYPGNEWLRAARTDRDVPVRVEPSDIDWAGPDDPKTLEKALGHQSTFLPIHFLEVGLRMAAAVCRVLRADRETGTGFLIHGDLLVTNLHVLGSEADAAGAKLQFNYQETPEGRAAEAVDWALDPGTGFWPVPENDLTVVRVSAGACARWGAVAVGAAKAQAEERVSIIQHPGGGAKQIAMHRNIVAYAGEKRVQYLTDTMPGSSGAPVFNNRWELVAVHSSGGWIRDPGTKSINFRNQGIAVGILREVLARFKLLAE
ncbi:serine protease : Probable serine protease OS=Sorangium cellulosum (strain So ce56) GN=sce7119 PE=4 SV=1: Trypsin_2 [Gemmata massiliana]|uniref:Serine protease n=1 Tax=Gemmata massiliana TaxID=1210884 RepID=A0A6P2CSW4_9BACT|nr:trypsin-like peptidase domain-containing protein [Gemmata massiliana]VTR92021.1 serine protease : Probable serine protease OS=Sorangium cellulosum (strain So ce56) GN=sce7119 PE=4 SV=1: Trypsin_2 [Gemmata massiliana]